MEDTHSHNKRSMWMLSVPRVITFCPLISTWQTMEGQLRSRNTTASYRQNPQNQVSLHQNPHFFFSPSLFQLHTSNAMTVVATAAALSLPISFSKSPKLNFKKVRRFFLFLFLCLEYPIHTPIYIFLVFRYLPTFFSSSRRSF